MFKISDWFKLILCTVLSSGVATAGNFGQMNFAYWQKVSTAFNATGGTKTSGNSYNQWTFTSSGTLVVSVGGTVNYLIIGAGGGGGTGGSTAAGTRGPGGGGGKGTGAVPAASQPKHKCSVQNKMAPACQLGRWWNHLRSSLHH